eukprot:TRINITY_DN8965_c0_g1_i1.p1 TRINITY_DN8965_c0_g1~~TRINITY_DN8965_c0_g1_i1.p1  ORF type:complete len:222 (-),score=50.73 TRINITY_DN8965_c0_g1_i1:98-763(-)
MFLSPEGKYFLSFQRVYSTSEYLEMVRAALPSIKVNVKSLYKEPMQKNLKLNRPAKKMIMTAHRYFSIDSFSDESSLPGMEEGGATMSQHFTSRRLSYLEMISQTSSSSPSRQSLSAAVRGTVAASSWRTRWRWTSPWWARRKLYYVLSALSVSILLRILFQTRSRRHNMVVTKKYFVYPLNRGGGEELDPGRGHAGYEEYQPFLAEEDCPPPYNPTIEWK